MNEKQTWDIGRLTNWEKNPRTVSKAGLERLKKQIEKLGQYKPLLVTSDGTVLGGNMRLKAYRELGITDVWVSVVEVLDLFGGSGSTLIACEQTGRTCYMMEMDPKYCDVIRKRYTKLIGKEEAWQEVTAAVAPR